MSRMRERHDTKLYYSISEASAIAKVRPHVLRYWETQFKMLRPKKNKAGNRMYRRRDLKLIQLIKELLYEKGYTIAGARRKLLDERAAFKEQLEIRFSEVDRSTMLLEIIRELKGVVHDLRGGREERAALANEEGNGAGPTDGEEEPAELEIGAEAVELDDAACPEEAELEASGAADEAELDPSPCGSPDEYEGGADSGTVVEHLAAED